MKDYRANTGPVYSLREVIKTPADNKVPSALLLHPLRLLATTDFDDLIPQVLPRVEEVNQIKPQDIGNAAAEAALAKRNQERKAQFLQTFGVDYDSNDARQTIVQKLQSLQLNEAELVTLQQALQVIFHDNDDLWATPAEILAKATALNLPSQPDTDKDAADAKLKAQLEFAILLSNRFADLLSVIANLPVKLIPTGDVSPINVLHILVYNLWTLSGKSQPDYMTFLGKHFPPGFVANFLVQKGHMTKHHQLKPIENEPGYYHLYSPQGVRLDDAAVETIAHKAYSTYQQETLGQYHSVLSDVPADQKVLIAIKMREIGADPTHCFLSNMVMNVGDSRGDLTVRFTEAKAPHFWLVSSAVVAEGGGCILEYLPGTEGKIRLVAKCNTSGTVQAPLAVSLAITDPAPTTYHMYDAHDLSTQPAPAAEAASSAPQPVVASLDETNEATALLLSARLHHTASQQCLEQRGDQSDDDLADRLSNLSGDFVPGTPGLQYPVQIASSSTLSSVASSAVDTAPNSSRGTPATQPRIWSSSTTPGGFLTFSALPRHHASSSAPVTATTSSTPPHSTNTSQTTPPTLSSLRSSTSPN